MGQTCLKYQKFARDSFDSKVKAQVDAISIRWASGQAWGLIPHMYHFQTAYLNLSYHEGGVNLEGRFDAGWG